MGHHKHTGRRHDRELAGMTSDTVVHESHPVGRGMQNFGASPDMQAGYNNFKPYTDNGAHPDFYQQPAFNQPPSYQQPAQSFQGNLVPPVGPCPVTSPYGVRRNPFTHRGSEFHPGVDLAPPFGTEIHAAGGGTVTRAGTMRGYGKCVMIDHGGGVETIYGHMNEIHVRKGQEIAQGGDIGTIGSTGRSTGPHLFFQVKVDGKSVDPTSMVPGLSDGSQYAAVPSRHAGHPTMTAAAHMPFKA